MSKHGNSSYRLILFVAGDEPNSTRAQENLERILHAHFTVDVSLTVVNVLNDFQAAIDHGIFITPALSIRGPQRALTIYGDLSAEEEVIASLRPALVAS